jgi:hypothetical protein
MSLNPKSIPPVCPKCIPLLYRHLTLPNITPPMTKSLFFFCILIYLTSCSRGNLLTYTHKKYYEENSSITSNSTFELYQTVCYNNPRIIDEEFCYYLTLNFIDTTAAKAKRTLDLKADTLIVKATYGMYSVWNWSDENNKLSGLIKILKWDKNEVVLSENIRADDLRRKETKKLIGTRTFKRKHAS